MARESRLEALVSNIHVVDTPDGLALKTGPSAYDEFYVQPITSDKFELGVSTMNRNALDAKSDQRVIRCERMISISVGTKDGNTSYGATCLVRGPTGTQNAKVCGDELVGHFNVDIVHNNKPTNQDLAEFVGRFCWGG